MPPLKQMPLRVLISLDQAVNSLFCGWEDETISSRTHRLAGKSKRWKIAKIFINALFFWQLDHCKSAYESEKKRLHLPPELRDVSINKEGGNNEL